MAPVEILALIDKILGPHFGYRQSDREQAEDIQKAQFLAQYMKQQIFSQQGD